MGNVVVTHDEKQRRLLQKYIFDLEDARDKAEELAVVHEQLKKSQDLLMAVLGSTTHGICLIRNDAFVWCNKAFSSILGWTQEELIGHAVEAIYPVDGHQATGLSPDKASRKQYSEAVWVANTTYEFDFRHKNGHLVPCLASRHLKDENDISKGYVLSVMDYTQLKTAETALKSAYEKLEERTHELTLANERLNREIAEHKETERKLNRYRNHLEELVKEQTVDLRKTNEQLQQEIAQRKTQEAALRELEELESCTLGAISHAVIVLKERTIMFANDAVERVFGWTPEELIGAKTQVLYASEEEYRRVGKVYRVLKTQKLHGNEAWCRCKDGRVIICRLIASRVGSSLADKHIVATYEDITDRKRFEDALKESEEKYRNIFENTIEGIFQTTADGRILSANPALAALYKAASPAELMDEVKDLNRLFVDAERRHDFATTLRKEGVLKNFEAKLQCSDGDTKWVSVNARSVVDKDGQIYYEGTFHDITERKKLLSELLHSEKMQAIGTLAGGVAHDINNILMGVQGYTSLMLFDHDGSEPTHQRLASIEELVRSGSNLTKQLLGFARGGKYEVRPIDINDVVIKSSSMFGRTKKELTVRTLLEKNLYAVEADHGQIEQVLVNLYLNAWQAMPGGGTLYLETRNVFLDEGEATVRSVSPGPYIVISVTDTGIGMDRRTRERIFEPFFTTKVMGRGTGLGLASVYGIIKNHGGFVTVYSEKGHGSTFTVHLPASAKTIIQDEPSLPEIVQGAETILVVDDEQTIAHVCKDLLEVLGYMVIVAGSGPQALDIYRARQHEIALVILDMVMPEMGGTETFRLLKSIDPDVRVILSSGYSMEDETGGITIGDRETFIQKPFGIHNLSQKIREVLDR